MLFAHAVPDHVIVGKVAPSPTDLGRFAQRKCVEVCEDLIREFGRKSPEKIDLELLLDLASDGRQLREAALGNDALEHEVAVFGRRG
jgi:hypothetical protein